MADKKSAAARKKHEPHKGEAKKARHEKKPAPEAKKMARAKGAAEAPAAKVKRGEKEKAPKQAKKAAKAAANEEGDEPEVELEEAEIEVAAVEVADDDDAAVAEDIDEDEDEDLPPSKKGSKATERKEVKDLLELGRDKGFLTYDEVNDALPADMVSSDQIDDVMSMFGEHDIEIVDDAHKVNAAARPSRPIPSRRTPRPRRRQRRGRGQTRTRTTRYSQVQRPGAHVPAQDGLGLAAHPRGRGRDRQAHRGRREGSARGRAQLAPSPSRRSSRSASGSQGQDPRQRGRQGASTRTTRPSSTSRAAIEQRACKLIDKIRKLDARDREASTSKLERRARSPRRKKQGASTTRIDARTAGADVRDALESCKLNKTQIDRIVAQAQEAHRARRQGRERDPRRASARPACRLKRDQARLLARDAREPRKARAGRARSSASMTDEDFEEIGPQPSSTRAAQGQARRGRGRCVPRRRAARRPTATITRASARPSAPRPSWSRRTCASWSRSPRSTRTAACSSST